MNSSSNTDSDIDDKYEQYEIIEQENNHIEAGSSSQPYNDTNISPENISLANLTSLKTSFVNALEAADYDEVFKIAQMLRKAMSYDCDPPLEDLVDCGVVPHIMKVLDEDAFGNTDLMVECTWIIANLASGTSDHVDYLLDYDIIDKALMLMNYPSEEVNENVMWILANISGDTFESRDVILERGIVHKLEMALDGQTFHPSFLCRVAWLISNLCRGKPYPKFSEIEPLLRIIQFLVTNVKGSDLISHCIWALSYITDGPDEQLRAVLDLGITEELLGLMLSNCNQIKAPALRTVANLLSGSDEFTSILIEKGVLKPLSKLLVDPNKVIRKEACWAISNIFASTNWHVQAIINYNNGEIIQKLFALSAGKDLKTSKECILGLANACLGDSYEHIQTLVDYGVIELFVKAFQDRTEVELLRVSLDAMDNILQYGVEVKMNSADNNPYIHQFEMFGGFEVIKKLKSYHNNEVQEAAKRIDNKYCDKELDFVSSRI